MKRMEQSMEAYRIVADDARNAVQRGIAEDVAAVASFFVETADVVETDAVGIKSSIEAELASIRDKPDCPPDIQRDLSNASAKLSQMTDVQDIEIFRSITVDALLRRYGEAVVKADEQSKQFGELRSRYAALCAVLQIQASDFDADRDGMKTLSAAVAALEKRVVWQAEQAYISDALNGIMIEMGYDPIGSRDVTKRSGKRFKNELFSYGDGTAINVTYDSEGQIAVELGGISKTDRIPTAEETDMLCEDMETFCSDFRLIEEKLKAKGVSIKSRLSMAPPVAEYASVINIEDYNINASKSVAELSVKTKRRKSSSQRALQQENP
jgi:hypothetical protein